MHTVKWVNGSIWSIDGTLAGSTNSGQSGPGSNGNEGVLYIPQNSRAGALPLNAVQCYIQDSPWGGS